MKAVLSICIILLTIKGIGQVPAEMVDAVKKLQFLEGVWKGQGWILSGDSKQFFNETETATIKTGGTLLQIDVFGTDVDNDQKIINNGLALVRYDTTKNAYEMDFYQSDGSRATATVYLLKTNIAEIILSRAGSFTKFVIEIRNKRWFEQAFSSPDGKNWTQFFEMDLRLQ